MNSSLPLAKNSILSIAHFTLLHPATPPDQSLWGIEVCAKDIWVTTFQKFEGAVRSQISPPSYTLDKQTLGFQLSSLCSLHPGWSLPNFLLYYTWQQKTWALRGKILKKKYSKEKTFCSHIYQYTYILVMGGPLFFLADLSQPRGHGGHTSFCTSGILLFQCV